MMSTVNSEKIHGRHYVRSVDHPAVICMVLQVKMGHGITWRFCLQCNKQMHVCDCGSTGRVSIDRRHITMRSAGASRRLQCDAPGLLCDSVSYFSSDVTLTSVFLFNRLPTCVAWRYQRGDIRTGVSNFSSLVLPPFLLRLNACFEWSCRLDSVMGVYFPDLRNSAFMRIYIFLLAPKSSCITWLNMGVAIRKRLKWKVMKLTELCLFSENEWRWNRWSSDIHIFCTIVLGNATVLSTILVQGSRESNGNWCNAFHSLVLDLCYGWVQCRYILFFCD